MVTDTEGNSLSLDDDDSTSSSSQSQLPEIEKLSISEYDKQVELRKESKAPQVDEDGFVQPPSRRLFRHYRKSIILVTSHRKVSLAPNLEFAQILCMHKTIDV